MHMMFYSEVKDAQFALLGRVGNTAKRFPLPAEGLVQRAGMQGRMLGALVCRFQGD